eukprot:944746-Pyramimonas_sp.AAC.1
MYRHSERHAPSVDIAIHAVVGDLMKNGGLASLDDGWWCRVAGLCVRPGLPLDGQTAKAHRHCVRTTTFG